MRALDLHQPVSVIDQCQQRCLPRLVAHRRNPLGVGDQSVALIIAQPIERSPELLGNPLGRRRPIDRLGRGNPADLQMASEILWSDAAKKSR